MFQPKPESPVTLEEVLLASGRYVLHYKDEDVCALTPKSSGFGFRPICIQQEPSLLSSDTISKALFDAGIVEESVYETLLAKVKAKQRANYEAQTRYL